MIRPALRLEVVDSGTVADGGARAAPHQGPAALSAGSDVLWNEDLHSGAVFEGMPVTKPFVPLTP
jgi:hypothetical protein